MMSELAIWFPQHAQALDMPLAAHLSLVGFDPATGQMPTPRAAKHGCGGCGSCSCG